MLKTRFHRLGCINIKNIQEASDTIIVCCVIHNVCILSADFLEEMLAKDDENDIGFHGPHIQDNAGTLKRNRIAAVLFRDRPHFVNINIPVGVVTFFSRRQGKYLTTRTLFI